jgi:hypothetical protein
MARRERRNMIRSSAGGAGLRARVLVVVGAGLVGSCATTRAASQRTPERPITEQEPAYLIAPDARLAVYQDILVGRVKGGAYDIEVGTDGAAGRGPLGPIDVHVHRQAKGYAVDGVWNGGKVSFFVAQDSIRGTADREVSSEDRSYESCNYDVDKLRGRNVYAGRETCLGADLPVRFDVQPDPASPVMDARTAVLMIAYLVAPPAEL